MLSSPALSDLTLREAQSGASFFKSHLNRFIQLCFSFLLWIPRFGIQDSFSSQTIRLK